MLNRLDRIIVKHLNWIIRSYFVYLVTYPFAQARFCGAEGLNNVMTLSEFKNNDFSKAYGLDFVDGPLETLHSRCVVVVDENGTVQYTEQVPEIVDEPNYKASLYALLDE